MSFLRTWNTVKYLKPEQIIYRLYYKLRAPGTEFKKSSYKLTPSKHTLVAGPLNRPSLISDNTAVFLNKSCSIAEAGSWNNPAYEKLWLYNLHYFDDLHATDAGEKQTFHKSFIYRWISENPIQAQGNGWEPYPLSLRIVNLIQYHLKGHTLEPKVIDSLYLQTQALYDRIEYHLLGNHLLANIKALIFSGLFFQSKESHRWLQKALRLLKRELGEQILPDGGHFERSPLYHSIIFRDLMDLLAVMHVYEFEHKLKETISKLLPLMENWLRVMTDTSDNLSFFNDTAGGIAPHPKELLAYYQRLGFKLTAPTYGIQDLQNSGFTVYHSSTLDVFMDTGSIAPRYIPGHAHAQSLAFELGYKGKRVMVNTGVSEYGTGPRRLYERSTAAHNCLVLDDKNSSEIWSGFRVARRAQVTHKKITLKNPGSALVVAEHNGYERCYGLGLHQRQIQIEKASVILTDSLKKTRATKAAIHFHFAPDITVEGATSNSMYISDKAGPRLMEMRVPEFVKWAIEDYENAPEFGVLVKAQKIILKFNPQTNREVTTFFSFL